MMPMFNQSSRTAILFGLGADAFEQASGGFTYNDSPYVHELNRALQLEQAAVATYAAKQRGTEEDSALRAVSRERTSCHHHALRELVRIIFAQRAIPDSDPATFTTLTSTIAARASKWIPSPVKAPVLDLSAHRIESALVKRYEVLVGMAPPTDIDTIKNLLEQSRDFSEESL